MFAFILFLSAFILSAVAEYFAIAGLIAIFAAAPISAIVLGASLAVGKLVAASWLYRNWVTAAAFLKWYFTAAVLILSIITSLGVFGYLSKAHLEHTASSGDTSASIGIIEERIKVQQDIIERARKDLKTLDAQIEKYTEVGSVSKGVKVRNDQKQERAVLNKEIDDAQTQIVTLREELVPLKLESKRVETEIGPIKYIAELIYGSAEQDIIDKAVRAVIILIIFVFDPLAILLLIAANMEVAKPTEKKLEVEEETEEVEKEDIEVPALVKPRKPKKPIPPKRAPKPIKPAKPKAEEDILRIKKDSVYRFDT